MMALLAGVVDERGVGGGCRGCGGVVVGNNDKEGGRSDGSVSKCVFGVASPMP